MRYFELGGMSTGFELEGFLYGFVRQSHDHDVIAHAINERFSELGRNHPVAYQREADDTKQVSPGARLLADERTPGGVGPVAVA